MPRPVSQSSLPASEPADEHHAMASGSRARPWPLRQALPWIVAGLVAIGLLAGQPSAWARPGQAPDYQTIPTLTPTPTDRGQQPTPTEPSGQASPTPAVDTPAPPQPTDTPAPGQPTATSTPTPAGKPSPAATSGPAALPADCWALPTPGFTPERLESLRFEAESDAYLVVPGQTVRLRLIVRNNGQRPASAVLLCAPLSPALQRGQPVASQGAARLEPAGMVAQLGDLAPGRTAQVELSLSIPADQPLGTVVENQAWLFSAGQRASTSLLTWALPPAWLPATGR